MKFDDITAEITRRIADIRDYHELIIRDIDKSAKVTPRHVSLGVAFVDVHLYGIIEYTIRSTVSRAVGIINGEGLKLGDIKWPMLALALDPDLTSLINIVKSKWDKRHEIFTKLENNLVVSIQDSIMPTDGKNYTRTQLESIWKTFCLNGSYYHDASFQIVLSSIVTNRINVAHGNVSGVDIGGSMQEKDVVEKINSTFAFCLYFVAEFESYLLKKEYLKTATGFSSASVHTII